MNESIDLQPVQDESSESIDLQPVQDESSESIDQAYSMADGGATEAQPYD